MFYDEGWVSLAEVTASVFRRLQVLQSQGKIADAKAGNLTPLLAITVWDMCDAATKIGCTGTDGTIIPASKELVNWADPTALLNEHVDLRAGTVGSSLLPDDDGNVPSREERSLRYGPFMNLPVVIPENNYASSLTFLAEEVAKPSRDDEVMRAAKTILESVAAKELVTRDTMRAKLGAAMSRRKFKLGWALAAEHHKILARPNRWAGL